MLANYFANRLIVNLQNSLKSNTKWTHLGNSLSREAPEHLARSLLKCFSKYYSNQSRFLRDF